MKQIKRRIGNLEITNEIVIRKGEQYVIVGQILLPLERYIALLSKVRLD